MCKKSLLMMLLLALLAPWAANAQTSLWSEDFEGGSMPAGWTTDGSGSWSVGVGDYSTSTGAGHGSYNAKITHGTTGAVTKLITPEIDLSTVASAELSFMHVQRSWAGDTDELKVYYRTSSTGTWTLIDGQDYTSAYASWTTEEGIALPNLSSTYQIAFEYVDHYGYGLGIDYVQIVQGASCVKPNGLTAALTLGNGTIATLSWSAGATETAWVLEYGTAADFTGATSVNVSGTPSKDLTGLTPETTYYARVKASCGGGDESEWSTTCEFIPTNVYTLTVNDGTDTHTYVPFYGFYADSDANSQFIIPADGLSAMTWGTIEKLTFYTSTGTAAWNGAVFDIYFSEVDYSAFETAALIDWSELSVKVYTGTVSVANNKMELTLTTPYNYMGGNLLIGFDETSNSSNYPSAPWYGVTQTNNTAVYKYSSNDAVLAKFLPKVTFGYTPGEEPACMWPTNLAVSNIGSRSVELSWTENGTATNWQICVNGDEANPIAANTNPYTLTGLTPETDYTVKVRSNCGDDSYSDWSTEISFTTEPSCYAPTDMVISDITASSANIGWTSDNTNFDMRYTTDLDPNNDFETSNLRGWTNIDADGDGYVWVLGSEAAGVYHNDGVDVTGQGYNSSHDFIISGSYSNYAGVALTPDNYLVSPQITLGGSISFWAQAQDADYCEEHFGVAVSTTSNTDPDAFTTIAEWTITNDSKGAVLREANRGPRGGNRAQTEWIQYTVDLKEYAGETGYVAIRHFNCEDQFLLNLDDIVIEQPGGFQVNWTDVTNPTNPQALTNLDDATTYVVQVRANCGGDDGVSRWLEGMFTTLPACMVPTNLVISNIDKRSADLAWTANGEETAWQISLNDGTNEQIFDATATTYSFTGLTPETRYIVKVRAVCDATLQSNWSSPATFTTLVACPAPTALAISDITNVSAVATWTYDGDVELEYAEDVWKYYDNGTFGTSMGAGGTIYWGILLTPDMLPANQPLTHIAMYENDYNANPTTISIYSGGDTAPGTFLYSEEVTPVGNGFHDIALAEPVEFDATQNLWIVCYNNADTYPAAGSSNLNNPNGRWVSLDGETWADMNDYGYNYTWMIRAAFGDVTTEWVAVNNPASPQTIAGLTPETNYVVRLRAVCGGEDGESVWVNTSFTTDIACPAPTALGATPYANSAVLSWEGISESYTVSYRTAAYTEGNSEEFATSSIPTGWAMYTGLLSNVMEDPTALVSATYGWTFGTGNGVFDSHARCNIYSNYQRWLVTPAIEVPTGAEFSFDMALTVFSSSSSASPTPGNQADDKFIVLVSTDNMATWTILRQWDNAGSEYVYDNITNNANGEHVSFDFGAYAGQTVKIAFYGESTVSGGDNNLHIDNVAIGTAMPAGEWMTVDADEAAATLTGLTPETKYEWKVQGNCGEWGMSEESAISSFTTTNDLCPVPTNLTVNNETITATTSDLSWEGSPDVESFTVRYRSPEYVVGGLSESFDVAGVPAGWTKYSGLVDEVIAGTTTLTTTTSGWNTTEYALGTYNMKVNIWGTSAKYWLVTPEVTLSSGNLSFDLALTDYGNADPIEDPTAQADDRFVVLVYADSTWTILREWNNSGSDYVYNTISATGQQVSIDLSAYVGQAIKIAFYGESTNPSGVANTGGDNDLHIDNVVIGNPQTIPATDWQLVENITDMNVTLTGLTPNTPYEAQVQNVCSPDSIWSNTVSFTTLVQTNVTQTIELVAGTNWFSTYVNITLADLKNALVAALGNTATITIKAKDKNVKFQRGRWVGQLTEQFWDLAQMYQIVITSDCEITLEGEPIDPTELTLNIVEGTNWIAYPYAESTTVANFFGSFAINLDQVKSKDNNTRYNRGRWVGQLTTLVPGQGYWYVSPSTTVRPFTFPAAAK